MTYFFKMHVDLVDACNLSCPTCYRGRRVIPNSPHIMPIDMFERIVKKAKSDNVEEIFLHNWTEPLLNTNLASYVKIVKAHGFPCRMSSNLALKNIPYLHDVFRAKPDQFWVSLSGMTNEIHQINHVNSDVNVIFHHLETLNRAAATDADIAAVFIWVKFLDFKYNTHEFEQVRTYVKENFKNLKIQCDLIPASGDPKSPSRESPLSRSAGMPVGGRIGPKACELQYFNLDLNSRGEVELCCGRPSGAFPEEILGNYLDMDAKTIKVKKITHPTCTEICKLARSVSFNDSRIVYWVFLAADYARSHNVKMDRVITIRDLSGTFGDSLPGVNIQSHSATLALDNIAPLGGGVVFIRLKTFKPVSSASLFGHYNTSDKAFLLKFVTCDNENYLTFLPAAAQNIFISIPAEFVLLDAFIPNLSLNA